MASSHLMESGPIIASLYVIGSQLFNKKFSPQIFHLITYLTNSSRFNRYFDIQCVQHFVDTRAMSIVAVSETASGTALL